MKAGFGSIAATTLVTLLLWSLVAAQQPVSAAISGDPDSITQSRSTSADDSHVRIVRLSEVTGDVGVYRGLGEGYEKALLNLPITEGTELRTGDGFAEVEFEDGSTLRLAPSSIVEFTELERASSGATLTTANVVSGTVYVSLARTPDNYFLLTFADQKATLAPSSHVRLFLLHDTASLAVLSGDAVVETPTGAVADAKKKTVNFEFLLPTQISLAKNVEDPYDAWDASAIAYHQHNANIARYGGVPGRYGISDLNYYGTFLNSADCGLVWRPYFASATWDPFANGSWVWYPQWGYTWVSPYPWGWMPYHYGAWRYCSDGWGWQPAGVWRGLRNPPRVPVPVKGVPPHFGLRPPHRPQASPAQGAPTVVPVNRFPQRYARLDERTGFMIPRDSAGLGVPRAIFGNLGKDSSRLEQRGSDVLAVNSRPLFEASDRGVAHGYVAQNPGSVRGSGSESSRVSGSASHASGGFSARSGGGSHSASSGGGGHVSSYSGGGGGASWGGGGGHSGGGSAGGSSGGGGHR